MTYCMSCGATNHNGLNLCELCRGRAAEWLTAIPIYFRNLARRRRPGRPNGTSGSGGTNDWLIRRGDTEHNHIEPALGSLHTWLDTRATVLALTVHRAPDEADTEAAVVDHLCRYLHDNITNIATQEWAGRFVADLGRHGSRIQNLTETLVPGWYAGLCNGEIRTMDGRETCGVPLHVIPGTTWIRCPACGHEVSAAKRLPVILEEAADWIAPPMRLAEAIVALGEEWETSALYERICKWMSRYEANQRQIAKGNKPNHKRVITPTRALDRDGDPVGPKRCRLGDVLDLMAAEMTEATRTDDTIVIRSA